MFARVESTAISGGSAEHHLTRPSDPSVAQVGEILPRLGITKRRFKQVESICLVREQRASGRQELAFNARPFVLCGLPLRRPLKDQLTHSRHSGKFFLQILGHPDYGLPFGQDRLIPIWVATLGLKQKSRIVRFQSAAEMLAFFRLQPDGFHYATFKLEDGVSFVHVATQEGEHNPLSDVAAFQRFQADIRARCDEPPVATPLAEVGSYRFHEAAS